MKKARLLPVSIADIAFDLERAMLSSRFTELLLAALPEQNRASETKEHHVKITLEIVRDVLRNSLGRATAL